MQLIIENTSINFNTKEKILLLLDNNPLGYKTINVWIITILEFFE
jgi:hypothetical protein